MNGCPSDLFDSQKYQPKKNCLFWKVALYNFTHFHNPKNVFNFFSTHLRFVLYSSKTPFFINLLSVCKPSKYIIELFGSLSSFHRPCIIIGLPNSHQGSHLNNAQFNFVLSLPVPYLTGTSGLVSDHYRKKKKLKSFQ